MPWGKVDDQLATHPKIIPVPLAAMGLWVKALSWSMRYLTDGYVPRSALPTLGARPGHAAQLVKAGLWHEELDGWRFHDWLDYQVSASDLRLRGEERSESARRGNHQRWHVERNVREPGCEYCQEASQQRSLIDRPVPYP
jgi:hypothetical protein